MPRIDPIQLLKCLGVLLSPNGGIKSKDEVHRLASLMTKFSKKLVSKCIYIQILKCTDTVLLGLFMGSGGWRLAHMWLTESIVAKNWPLVKELLELLLLCPVDIERLKTNNCPKLVKELSKDGSHSAIRALAAKLVEQWLKTVKGEHVMPVGMADIPQIINDAVFEPNNEVNVKEETVKKENVDKSDSDILLLVQQETTNISGNEQVIIETIKIEDNITVKAESNKKESDTLPILKISLKDGKQVVSHIDENEKQDKLESDKKSKSSKSRRKSKDKSRDRSSRSPDSKTSSSKQSSVSRSHSSSEKHRNSSSNSSSSSSKKNSSSDHKLKDKSKDSSHSSSSKHKDSSKRKATESSSYDRSKDEKTSRNSKSSRNEKTRDEKSQKGSSDSQRSTKEQNDKNKETLEKLQPPSIHRLGKIPKLTDSKKEAPSISIEVRKPNDPNRPKTVKTFHSKFRSHGLEEEIKPPPSRASVLKKPPLVLPPTVSIPKRPSPSHNEAPPEKKPKTIEPQEKPGSIKLIPAKPKPILLLESDMFMDALNASATNKKEPRKRKRRTSGSKDGNPATDTSPPHTPTPSASSPNSENKSTPLRFYQDTLDTEEDKEKEKPDKEDETEEDKQEVKLSPKEECESPDKETEEPMEVLDPETKTVNGLKGVLCYHKRKGPKKSIRWRPDPELEEIQYFELDETERVNVTKTFMDAKNSERVHERESFQKARNLTNDDVMEAKISWRPLALLEADGQIPVEYGKNSKEKDIQAARQKGVLQTIYFHKALIPESAAEPELETHTHSEPCIIPLEDITGNQDNVSDFRNVPWPEPKGNMPATTPSSINMPHMFHPPISPFPGAFPNPQFGGPGFQGPGSAMVTGDWQNGMPPNIMGPGNMALGNMPPGPLMAGPMPPGAMPPGSMPPGLMMAPDNIMMGPEMFGGPGQMFSGPLPPDNFNMMDNMNPQNMFPPDYNMQGLPGPDNLSGSFNYPNRGSMRGRGMPNNNWRGKGNSWEGPPRGRGGHSRGGRKGTMCIYFQKKGSCRQGDKCSFLHPGVNCPY